MQSATYTSGTIERPLAPVFGIGIRPVRAALPLGRVQCPYPLQLSSGESTSEAARGGHSSEDSRPTKVRGSLRGRREDKILVTKPSNIASKMGTTGTVVSLRANYFPLKCKPNWNIHQYHVDFKPEVHSPGLRKFLVRDILTEKGNIGYIFDGSLLFTVNKITDEPVFERISKGKQGDEYLVIFKFTKNVSTEDSASVQVLNIILRRAMDGLELQLVGRNFFDPDDRVSFDIPFFRFTYRAMSP